MSNSNVHFRLARAEDSVKIAELCLTQICENEYQSTTALKEGIHSMIQDSNKGRVFLGERTEQIVAVAFIFSEWSEWRNHPMWWIQKVCILPEVDTEETLQDFFSTINSNAKKEGATTLRLIDVPGNESMVQVGIKNGMESHYRIFEEIIGELPN